MGSGRWFRSIIGLKKPKEKRSKQVHSSAEKPSDGGSPGGCSHGGSPGGSHADPHAAATRIQKAFRAYLARKAVSKRKCAGRFNVLIQGHTVKQQTSSTLNHLHSWCNIQAQIRARRLCMVTQGRIKQKRLESQMKLEAKLHEIEVEWCGGSETMEVILSRIQQREDAAVKRERAMAYAFSHQWRANASQYLGQASYSLGKEHWGWSWVERWIAARPWEVRAQTKPIHQKKAHSRQGSKLEKEMKSSVSTKPALSNGKGPSKPKKISPSDG